MSMRSLFSIVAMLMLWIAGPAYAATPTTIHASYDIYKAGIRVGEIEEDYRRDNDKYTLVSVTRAVGIFSWFKSGKIIVKSNGVIDAHGLRPLSFSADNENNKKDRKHAEFDWDTKKILLTRDTEHSTMDLPGITQDRLSAMYQFMFLTLQAETLVAFPMLNGHYLTNLRFDVTRGGTVKTPAGEFTTMYLDNQGQKARERTEIWVADQSWNLPVKMVITDDSGGKLTQTLRKLQLSQ